MHGRSNPLTSCKTLLLRSAWAINQIHSNSFCMRVQKVTVCCTFSNHIISEIRNHRGNILCQKWIKTSNIFREQLKNEHNKKQISFFIRKKNRIPEWLVSGRWFWAEHPDSQRQKQKVLFSEKCWLNTLCPTIESCCGVTRCVTDPKRLLFPFIDLFILGWIDTVKPRVGQKKNLPIFFLIFLLKNDKFRHFSSLQ